jgi:hypothetical protein
MKPVELELPRLDGVAEATDQEHVRPVADLLGPDVEFADADVLPHVSALLRPPVRAMDVLERPATVERLHKAESGELS